MKTLLDVLEPVVDDVNFHSDRSMSLTDISIAISLRRIADILNEILLLAQADRQ